MLHPGRKRYKGRKCNVKVENVIKAESVIRPRKCNIEVETAFKVENATPR